MAKKKFTVIAEDAFDSLQLEAGVLLTTFDPANPVRPASENIIATTSGGFNPNCAATYTDYGEDVDNVPANMKELKQLDSWDCSMSFTTIKFNAENTKWALGAADIETHEGYKVVKPRRDVDLADFKDVWWVGDKANGGAFAVKLLNAISTGGLNIQTTKNGKGTNQLTLTGHVSITDQDRMPMEFYDIDPSGTATVFSVTQNLTHVTSSFTDDSVEEGDPVEAVLTADSGYAISTVTVTVNGIDATASVYDSETHTVSIGSASGNIVITATATEVETHSVTQTLTNVISSFSGDTVNDGAAFTATLTAEASYEIASVTVEMGSDDITSTAWNSGTGTVTIASVTDDITITATAS